MSRVRMKRRRRTGFTLFEVLLVLVILIILTSSVSYYVIGAQKKANQRAAKAQIGLFESMLTDYHIDCGGYPSTEQGLVSLRVAPENMTKWAGPYANKDIPNDPWGNPYQYESTGGAYRIWSWGEDGQDGTGDEISNT
jgi:general secretion pathway protein G